MPTLRLLCESGRRPALVVTQPDRPRGRGHQLQQPPVAQWAVQQGLIVAQPKVVGEPDFLDRLREMAPSRAVVVAFGQIFPKTLLELPTHGCINVHASLLPRYRGAAPIQAAIMAGDQVTGVTTMLMDAGLDTGPILLQRELEIGDQETAGGLAARLAELGAETLIETLVELDRQALDPRPQPQAGVSVARRLRRSDGLIDWRVRSQTLFNQLRGLSPWPGVATVFREQPLKVLWGRPEAGETSEQGSPGNYLGLEGDHMRVCCGEGTVFVIERLQKPGRKPVSATSFANGERLQIGERFG